MKKFALITAVFLFALLLNACSADEIEEQTPQSVDVQTTVPPTTSNFGGDQGEGGDYKPDR